MARPAITPEKREQMRSEIRGAVIRIIGSTLERLGPMLEPEVMTP